MEEKVVTTNKGNQFSYEHLISTLPLDILAKLSGQTQFEPIVKKGLLHSSSNIVGIGIKGTPPPHLKSKCWMYFPESNCPFYRVTVFSNYSPNHVPQDGEYWSLMCDVSESEFKQIDRSKLIEEVYLGCLNTQLIQDSDEVVSKWTLSAGHGYPTPGVYRDEALGQMIPFFESFQVYSRGRFGMWKYEVSNQDHSFMQGVEIVERLLNGRIELTAFDANHVNAKKHPWPFEAWIN